MPTKYSGAEWLENELKYRGGKELSPLGKEVADILGQVFGGIYHIDDAVFNKNVDWSCRYYIAIVIRKDLATFDFNELTSLVVLCHDRMIRLDIGGIKKGYLSLLFHSRKGRTGGISERMPYFEDHLKIIRDAIGLPVLDERGE